MLLKINGRNWRKKWIKSMLNGKTFDHFDDFTSTWLISSFETNQTEREDIETILKDAGINATLYLIYGKKQISIKPATEDDLHMLIIHFGENDNDYP